MYLQVHLKASSQIKCELTNYTDIHTFWLADIPFHQSIPQSIP